MNHVQVKTAAATMGEFFDLFLRMEILSQGSLLRSSRDRGYSCQRAEHILKAGKFPELGSYF